MKLSPEVQEVAAIIGRRHGNTVSDKVLKLAETACQLCDKFYKLGCEHASKGMESAVSSIVTSIECKSLRNDIEWLLRKSYANGYEAGRTQHEG